MLTVHIGQKKMVRRQNIKDRKEDGLCLQMMSSFETVQCVVLVVSLLVCALLILQQLSDTINADWSIPLPELSVLSSQRLKSPAVKSDECGAHKDCPKDQFSFFIQSGAANVVAPKICLQNNLVLGDAKDNADFGINIVVINGKTGEIIMTSHFNMWDGDVKTLIEFLKSIKDGSAVLMTTFDDPATKLNEEARKLIADMGSSAIRSLGVRDNWIFVGGKGAMFQSHYEMHVPNNKMLNKYDNWPELIELQGCIPKYME